MKNKRNKIYFIVTMVAVLLLLLPILPVEAMAKQTPGFVCSTHITIKPQENTTTVEKVQGSNVCVYNPTCTNATHNENCYPNNTTDACPYNPACQNTAHDGTCNQTGNGHHGGGHRGNGRHH